MLHSELKLTEDGSHTLYLPQIDECYHSTYGAIQESVLIFIQYGLLSCTKKEINILEIGFGTGLNAFLTLAEADQKHFKVNYTGLEFHPITIEKAILLNYPELIAPTKRKEFERLHLCEWNKKIDITSQFLFKKTEADFTSGVLNTKYDIIYFDPFSPEKQPEMWTEEQFRKLYLASNKDAILTTYCCKGNVKRALKSAGFLIEKLPGPAGKREVLRARV
ncbi:MAG: tRNA (5-methylaminomethyl-2-thiouridine)(34)-methyltransferase MnmD [Paludibacteraceae bacterium]